MTVATRVKAARFEEALVRKALSACVALCATLAASIAVVLTRETAGFLHDVSPVDFLTGLHWSPLYAPRSYGVVPLVAGTVMITLGAALIGLPAGLGVALFLNEHAPPQVRRMAKPVMEILAAVPTVIYGYFALATVTPMLRRILPATELYNGASAAFVLGIMTLPLVATLCDDAIRAVPQDLKDGGYALGTTRFEVAVHVTVPSALSGIVASFMLAVSRAFGETMAVTLAAGHTARLTANPLVSVQTLTAYIARMAPGEWPHGGIEYRSIFAVGAVLFVVTMAFNLLAYRLVRHFRRTER